MNIGIFSKFEMCGGSEFRGCELANGINKFTDHKVTLLVRGGNFPSGLKDYLDPNVNVVLQALANPEHFYQQDAILTINTDSKEFTKLDYWLGRTASNSSVVQLGKIKKMCFLFNFLISPSRYLHEIEKLGPKVGIITTNKKFFDEVTKQDRYEYVRHLPRIKLESPIDIDRYDYVRKPQTSTKICVGMHSKGLGNKWNEDLPYVVRKLNERFKDNNPFEFQFMGMSADRRNDFQKANLPNVKVYKENEIPVRQFLKELDVFMFMPSWKREEPWARVMGEAMMSGCCILATDKGGNQDQVLKGNNGFLCKRKDDFVEMLCHLKAHPDLITRYGENARRMAVTEFQTKEIIRKLDSFLQSF